MDLTDFTGQDNENNSGQSRSESPTVLRDHPHDIPLTTRANRLLPDGTGLTRNVRDEDLPDIDGFAWDLPEKWGPATVKPLLRLGQAPASDSPDAENVPGDAAVVIDGGEAYLEKHLLTDISHPRYYSRFDEYTPSRRWSVDGYTHVTGPQLKRAVRLANGSGRIDMEATECVLCAPGTVAVAGPRGLFLSKLYPPLEGLSVPGLDNPPAQVKYQIRDYNIPEENPKLRQGLQRYLDVLEKSEYPLPRTYDAFDPGACKHQFVAPSGDEYRIGDGLLERFATHDQTPSEIAGTYECRDGGTSVETLVTEADLPGSIGTTQRVVPVKRTKGTKTSARPEDAVEGVIGGYSAQWTKHSPGFRQSASHASYTATVLILTGPGEATTRHLCLGVKSFDN